MWNAVSWKCSDTKENCVPKIRMQVMQCTWNLRNGQSQGNSPTNLYLWHLEDLDSELSFNIGNVSCASLCTFKLSEGFDSAWQFDISHWEASSTCIQFTEDSVHEMVDNPRKQKNQFSGNPLCSLQMKYQPFLRLIWSFMMVLLNWCIFWAFSTVPFLVKRHKVEV
jgi:hypothetical protein